jgi:flagellin-like protein
VNSLRGITPVIAIILLLLMTVSAAGVAFVWINTIQGQIIEGAEAGLETDLQRMHGEFAIEAAWNVSTKICMTIRNSNSRRRELQTTGCG